MPQVKTINPGGSVAVRNIPDGTIRVNVNPDQFGGGIARGLGNIGQNLVKMKAEDDATAATEAFNNASEEARKYLYDGDTAVYSQQGKNAVGSHDTSKKFFDETASKYSGELKNDNQRKAFTSLWGRRVNTNLDNVARHEASQRKVYFEDTQKANLTSNIDFAANNYDKPDEIQSALLNAQTIIASNPMGSSAETVAQKQALAKSEIHKAVVSRMMIDDPDGAREWYNANKDQINGADHKAIESALKGNKQKKQAQSSADKIMQSDKTDAEKRSSAKKIKNPDVRALTEGLVNQDIQQRKTDRIEQERQMNEAFWDEFITNPDINNIPANLPAKTQLAAIKFATGSTRKTDLKRWNEINQISINDPDKFVKMDLTNNINNLDESDFQAFGKLQRTIGKDKLKLTHVQSVNSKATKALKNIDKTVDSDSGQLFMRKFQDDITAFETDEGRKINPDEVDKIIDRLMIEGEVRGTIYDPDKRLFEVDPTEEFFIENVPQDDRAKITDWFKRNKGIGPTEEQIIDAYTLKVTKK